MAQWHCLFRYRFCTCCKLCSHQDWEGCGVKKQRVRGLHRTPWGAPAWCSLTVGVQRGSHTSNDTHPKRTTSVEPESEHSRTGFSTSVLLKNGAWQMGGAFFGLLGCWQNLVPVTVGLVFIFLLTVAQRQLSVGYMSTQSSFAYTRFLIHLLCQSKQEKKNRYRNLCNHKFSGTFCHLGHIPLARIKPWVIPHSRGDAYARLWRAGDFGDIISGTCLSFSTPGHQPQITQPHVKSVSIVSKSFISWKSMLKVQNLIIRIRAKCGWRTLDISPSDLWVHKADDNFAVPHIFL